MIPLGTGDIPATGEALSQRVSDAITTLLQSQGSTSPRIQAEMESVENITNLTVDLSGTKSAATTARKPASLTKLGDVTLGKLSVGGNPVEVHGAPVQLDISVQNLPMEWSRDDHSDLWLVPADRPSTDGETTGSMEISCAVNAIEKALHRVATDLADSNGARLKDIRLRVESAGPRSLVVGADVAASKFMMTAKVRAIAEINLDDDMNLQIRSLDVTGDGAAGNMVANLFSDKIAQWRGREIPLAQYMFAGAVLEDVHFEVTDQIKIAARFGSGSPA